MVWFTRYARPSRHQGPAASWRDSARVSGSPSRPGYQTDSVSQNSFIKFLRQFLSLAKFCFQFFFFGGAKHDVFFPARSLVVPAARSASTFHDTDTTGVSRMLNAKK